MCGTETQKNHMNSFFMKSTVENARTGMFQVQTCSHESGSMIALALKLFRPNSPVLPTTYGDEYTIAA